MGFTIENLFDRPPFHDPDSFPGDSSDYAGILGRRYRLALGYRFRVRRRHAGSGLLPMWPRAFRTTR